MHLHVGAGPGRLRPVPVLGGDEQESVNPHARCPWKGRIRSAAGISAWDPGVLGQSDDFVKRLTGQSGQWSGRYG